MGDVQKISVEYYLHLHGNYLIITKESLEDAYALIKKGSVELIVIIDPNPVHLCMQIREFSNTPIIVKSIIGSKEEGIKSLNMGADDYLYGNVYQEEFSARIEAVLRRSGNDKQIVELNQLVWDKRLLELKYQQKVIPLAPKEFNIIGVLLQKPEKVFTNEELVLAVWGNKDKVDSKTLHSYIRNIRGKMRDAAYPVDLHLITVWGVGYRWHSLQDTTN